MAAKALSRDDIAFGRAVLLATDSLGMSVEGAFWLYDKNDDDWRYFLVTSLSGRIGTREIYLRLNGALAKKLSEKEAKGFVFYLADPREKLVLDLRHAARTEAYASEPMKVAVVVNGKKTKACVYRLAANLDDDSVRGVQRRFRRYSNELAVV
jgi:hypothetical protein